VIKGGLALQLRLGDSASRTKDIDLTAVAQNQRSTTDLVIVHEIFPPMVFSLPIPRIIFGMDKKLALII
jgi:hypothetical protein